MEKDSKIPKPIVLIILDGWGLAPPGPGNAISQAETPNMDSFWVSFPHAKLYASGESVGLPHGEMGNSEVGHLNLGAGRIVYQDLPRINMAIADGSFFKNRVLLAVARHVRENGSCLHLMGLVSPGGVHSSIEHLYALLRFAKDQALEKVFVHVFTDGRDTSPTSSPIYIKELEEKMEEMGVGKIASVMGRYYAMDRDHRWERTQKAYELLTLGRGETASSALEAVQKSYQANRTDEFVLPTVILDGATQSRHLISENDGVVFFNFREDRARQLTKAFVLPNLEAALLKFPDFDPYVEKYHRREEDKEPPKKAFPRGPKLANLFFVTLTQYEPRLPVNVAFGPEQVDLPLGRILAERNLRQLHISETEKYPHVTYYFNGGREEPFPGEDRVMVPSPKVATYDLRPEMSAVKVTDLLLEKLRSLVYDFAIVNFVNPDMVGHTGVIKAAIKAVEAVDKCLEKTVRQTLALGGACVVCADHGNVEIMINRETGEMDTEHSATLVPCIIIKEDLRGKAARPMGILADVAPTILDLLQIPKPSEMTGRSLLS